MNFSNQSVCNSTILRTELFSSLSSSLRLDPNASSVLQDTERVEITVYRIHNFVARVIFPPTV